MASSVTCTIISTTLAKTTPSCNAKITYLQIKPLNSNFFATTPSNGGTVKRHHPSIIHCTPQQHQQLLPWKPPSPENLGNSLFENFSDNSVADENDNASETTSDDRPARLQLLKWPLWVVGPAVLLATGAGPTLWLHIPASLLGPNVVTLLALTGLDCLFNLGTNLFLLASHSAAGLGPAQLPPPPRRYRLWNVLAALVGFLVPMATALASRRGLGVMQPPLGLMATAVLLGPYLLLVAVQTATEALLWQWGSPAWAAAPVAFGVYRVLQLARGLRLGLDLGMPEWAMHGLRVLVSWWVFVLGIQLMWVASLAANSEDKGL